MNVWLLVQLIIGKWFWPGPLTFRKNCDLLYIDSIATFLPTLKQVAKQAKYLFEGGDIKSKCPIRENVITFECQPGNV